MAKFQRRDFLKVAGLTAASLALGGCVHGQRWVKFAKISEI